MKHTVDQAAAITGYNPENIRQMLRKKQIPGAKKNDLLGTGYSVWMLNDRSIDFLIKRRKSNYRLTKS